MAELRAVGGQRKSFALLGAALLVAVVFLAVGSDHPLPQSQARVAYLESVLKCPSCTDLSIGQSTSGVAQQLDREVVRGVAAGKSDEAIEAAVLASFPGSLLVPRGGLGVAVVVIPIVLVALAAAAGVTFFVRLRRRGGHDEMATDG